MNADESPSKLPPSSPTEPGAGPDSTTTPSATVGSTGIPRVPRVFGRFGFWITVLPFIVYLVGTMLGGNIEDMREEKLKYGAIHSEQNPELTRLQERKIDPETAAKERILGGLLPLAKSSYPYTYITTMVITTLTLVVVGWGYFRAPLRINWLSIVLGILGVVVWIGLVELDRRFLHLGAMMSKGRPGYDPFTDLKDHPTFLWQFLAIRFYGLALIVPLVEEFFLRGFLIRYVDDPDWDEIPLGQATWKGWISPTVYGLISHPAEPLAALAWFSLVTWFYKRTGSIWDCVVIHAVTNLLLGLYVIQFGAYHLW